MDENQNIGSKTEEDYSFVTTIARIALYDDLRSAPRIIEINPSPTNEYIEEISTKTYEQARLLGGSVPYTVIREVSENFIHADFSEIVVSILNKGNTIRFSDQGPGIQSKEKAQKPGFTSAIEPMKRYIRGVGSGLPIVKEYLDFTNGTITIEDNLNTGAVVTINLVDENVTLQKPPAIKSLIPPLSEKEKYLISLFASEGALGITDLAKLTDYPQSSIYVTLSKLEENGLIEKTIGKKRILTDLGFNTSESL